MLFGLNKIFTPKPLKLKLLIKLKFNVCLLHNIKTFLSNYIDAFPFCIMKIVQQKPFHINKFIGPKTFNDILSFS